jgi:serine/threonine-protein kinase HipA
MARQEAYVARQEQRSRRQLDDWAYLLGVADVGRMGALRLRTEDGRAVDDRLPSIPPMARLPELVAAARSMERSGRDQRREAHDLAVLVDPGSSLGGARPKASVQGDDGSLWIAKFPSRADTRDMAACEWVLDELAAAAGIPVPEHRLEAIGRGHRVFLARRFDRVEASRRLYASAMTMVGRRDREEASYLDIALAIADHGARGTVQRQLADLFRRIVFGILVAHRDDHLRNHGFLRTRAGWELAPAFDLNPMPEKSQHELAIDEADHGGGIETLLATAAHYRLTTDAAHAIVSQVRDAIAGWRAVAKAARVGRAEMEALEDAIDA